MLTLSRRINGFFMRIPVWPVYVLGVSYTVAMFLLALNGKLGVDPVKALEHDYGLRGLQILVFVLAITPLQSYLGINLIRFRRSLGILVFYFICCHFLIWLVLDVQILAQIVEDIIKRPYITIGMAGFILLIPLALTSNNFSMRKLARRWKKLHRLTYPIAILAGVHFFMVVKGFQIEPLIYLFFIIILLFFRISKVHDIIDKVFVAFHGKN